MPQADRSIDPFLKRLQSATVLTAILPILFMTGLVSCDRSVEPIYREWRGQTMGTYYAVKALTDREQVQEGIDSLLAAFNTVFSTYDAASILSGFNRSGSKEYCVSGPVQGLAETLDRARAVYEETGGYFDPTVMPLVSYWGFGTRKFERESVDSAAVDSILRYIGMEKLRHEMSGEDLCLNRSVPGVTLDLSAIAKGYGVDLVAEYLGSLGISDYMVDIGGEIIAKGVNQRGSAWTIAIDKPVSSADLKQRQVQAVIELADRAIASSGNYRNFYLLDGALVGHTINPITGYPEVNDLLAVSVVSDNCMYADALATGFMAMGYSRARSLADSLDGVEAYFIRMTASEGEGGAVAVDHTPGMAEIILSQDD